MTTLTPTKRDIQLALAISNRATLSEIVLTKCSVSGTRDRALVEPFTMNVRTVATRSNVEGGNLEVEVNFEFKSLDGSETPVVVFLVDCVFWISYQLEEGFTPEPEQIAAFSNGNVIYNCWPYLREFVQSTAMRMGHTPPPLPLLRVKPKSEPKAE